MGADRCTGARRGPAPTAKTGAAFWPLSHQFRRPTSSHALKYDTRWSGAAFGQVTSANRSRRRAGQRTAEATMGRQSFVDLPLETFCVRQPQPVRRDCLSRHRNQPAVTGKWLCPTGLDSRRLSFDLVFQPLRLAEGRFENVVTARLAAFTALPYRPRAISKPRTAAQDGACFRVRRHCLQKKKKKKKTTQTKKRLTGAPSAWSFAAWGQALR